MQAEGILNPNEAPPGYFAVLKADAKPKDGSNICRACDWRPDCSGERYRCMPFDIVTSGGNVLRRNDGCSVVFKSRKSQGNLFETEVPDGQG